MAEVERRFVGRFPSAVPSVETLAVSFVLSASFPTGKDFDPGRGCVGNVVVLWACLVETDWERCRIEDSEVFRLLWLWLLEER